MVLESTIVCVDNSEYSRNGDFPPSRFVCQMDSVNMLCASKVQSNAESSVGLLTLAGRSARILITSTRDLGRIFTCMHDVNFDGQSDFVAGILKAQLALKHRQNSLQRQRIIVFVTSPITATTERLVKLGKNLKKNSVAVDIINVGMEPENEDKINAFMESVKSNDNSHALHVNAGTVNLADAVMSSNINIDPDSSAGGAAAAAGGIPAGVGVGGAGDLAGMDGEGADPELEMVLRISMEEERARQAAARQAEEQNQATENANNNSPSTPTNAANEDNKDEAKHDAPASAGGASSSITGAASKYDDYDADADLYGTSDVAATSGQVEEMEVEYDDDDDEMLRRAIELSTRVESEVAAETNNGEKKEDKDEDTKQS